MRFGVATNFKNFDTVVNCGYDYFEGNLSAIAAWTEEEFADALQKVQAAPIKMEAVNGFYPKTLPIVGPERDMAAVKEYTQKALARAAKLGVKVAVLGSGAARRVPEGYGFAKAYNEFAEVLQMCGEIAAELDITIAIEPLRKEEVNLINTVAEGIEMCKKVNHPNIKCLADFYHVFSNGETMDAIRAAGEWLAHTHIARPGDRKMPSTEEDIVICRSWAQALKICGYDARMSLEGGIGGPEEFESVLKATRPILEMFNA